MEKRSRAILYLVLTAILWSLGGVLIKSVKWNPVAIAGARSAIASLVMLAYIRRPRFTWSRAQILAAIFYAGTVILFVTANKLTTAANAILLQYGAPVYVAIFGSIILKEKTTTADWITISLVIFGMFLFFLDELRPGDLSGNIIAILSGITFALYIVFMRKQKDESPIESTLLGNILTVIIGLPFMLSSSPETRSSWIGILLLGTIQLGISYILYSIAIKDVTALEAILIPIIEPVLNPVWVFLAMGETPGRWAFVGGAIILASVTLRYTIPLVKNIGN
ncbi:MAG TPA: DMT family transporter [bacterium]|jgi:drug/metabolite transporter (DMT)-like permease|nr:EamA family transporter [Dictyoglomota bacterium]HHV81533.1 EamA family transporter [bacterium]HON71853.1 DMT family transporter [bacterium]HPC77874.1 DMT family transporter [bacterium]